VVREVLVSDLYLYVPLAKIILLKPWRDEFHAGLLSSKCGEARRAGVMFLLADNIFVVK
jgi:hypothetical protein